MEATKYGVHELFRAGNTTTLPTIVYVYAYYYVYAKINKYAFEEALLAGLRICAANGQRRMHNIYMERRGEGGWLRLDSD